MTAQVGISSLTDFQPVASDGRRITAQARTAQVVDLGVRADRLGLDIIGIGEHHSRDFVVSSPAVVLAAIAARTESIRLTSAVTVLSVLDPVRVYQDFASLDLVSAGRAEIATGRSAFAEPFALFGLPLSEYDELFEEKLDLLLRIRDEPELTWEGRYRPPLAGEPITPRALQDPLPIWVGVGGSPDSVVRAARLGLPLIIGYLGGPPQSLLRLTDLYRKTGDAAGTSERLRIGVGLHYFANSAEAVVKSTYPYYQDFLRPKHAGGSGFMVSASQFEAGRQRDQALMIGDVDYVTEKLIELHRVIAYDRVQALVDWGGLPPTLVEESLDHLGRRIAPALRLATSQ